ncbi:MAG TPA: ECF-type sigma factor [Nitrososphaera sp.]|nr:ECF-type sigma factor [Nitrososphaera sp.]
MDSNLPSGEVTRLLREVKQGDADATSKLVKMVYSELRKIARRKMRKERKDHTLDATALVHEAYVRLVGAKERNWQSRTHFFGIAANTMRQILVDYARRHNADKRPGKHQKVYLDALAEMPLELMTVFERQDYSAVLMIDNALSKLQKQDPQQGRLVVLRFFVGLTEDEAAEVLGISLQQVKREWRLARTWLRREVTK